MADVVAPTATEYFPGGHCSVHAAVSPAADEKLPAAQAPQIAESVAASAVEYCPAPHKTHELDAESPNPDPYAPAEHATQAPDPMALLCVEYRPAPHSVHALDP